jgi:hypothetical protein
MAAGIAHVTAGKRMATDFRVIELPVIQGKFARHGSASGDKEGCKGGKVKRAKKRDKKKRREKITHTHICST